MKIGALDTEASLLRDHIFLVDRTCGINIHQVPEDGAVRGKIGGIFQNIFNRQFVIHLNSTRPANDASSRRNSPNQYFSLGEAPFTIAIVLVSGERAKYSR